MVFFAKSTVDPLIKSDSFFSETYRWSVDQIRCFRFRKLYHNWNPGGGGSDIALALRTHICVVYILAYAGGYCAYSRAQCTWYAHALCAHTVRTYTMQGPTFCALWQGRLYSKKTFYDGREGYYTFIYRKGAYYPIPFIGREALCPINQNKKFRRLCGVWWGGSFKTPPLKNN